MEWQSASSAETWAIGRQLGGQLAPGAILCLFGDLGAGKTTLVKGIAEGLHGQGMAEVTSPTFTYLNIYAGAIPLYHFDLYRLRDADEFLSMGFEEFLHAGGVCCVEWSEKIKPLIPAEALHVTLTHQGGDNRTIYAV